MEEEGGISPGIPDPCILLGGQPRSGTTLLSSILRSAPGHTQAFELHVRKPSFLVGLDGRYTRNIFAGLGLPPDRYDEIVGACPTEGMNLGSWVGPKEEVSAEPLTGHETDGFSAELAARGGLVTSLMREVAGIEGAETWGFKILGDIEWSDVYATVWPNARFVTLIRDPRDQIASLLEVGQQRLSRNQPNFYENISAAAAGWERTITTARNAAARAGAELHEVLYEELVSDPNSTLLELGDRLGVQLLDGLDFYTKEFVADHMKRMPHHQNLGNPINTSSVGRWKLVLEPKEVGSIEGKVAGLMASLGYS